MRTSPTDTRTNATLAKVNPMLHAGHSAHPVPDKSSAQQRATSASTAAPGTWLGVSGMPHPPGLCPARGPRPPALCRTSMRPKPASGPSTVMSRREKNGKNFGDNPHSAFTTHFDERRTTRAQHACCGALPYDHPRWPRSCHRDNVWAYEAAGGATA